MKNLPKIVFMGTPEFAVASLESLIETGYPVEAVVTAADKPSGRGQKLNPSPVKKCALSAGLKVLQPVRLKSRKFINELTALNPDIFVVVAFRMLPEEVWSIPSRCTFNLHASLLPQYRGAAPIQWAIINGETETGVTTFVIDREIDTGKIILQEPEPIFPEDTAGTLYERLMKKGANLVVKTVALIESGSYALQEQQWSADLKPAPKLSRETGKIDWNQKTIDIHNLIRGLSPYPAAWTNFNGQNYKIYHAQPGHHDDESDLNPGSWTSDGKSYLIVRTGDGWLSIKELQSEGKRRMRIEEFLRGNSI